LNKVNLFFLGLFVAVTLIFFIPSLWGGVPIPYILGEWLAFLPLTVGLPYLIYRLISRKLSKKPRGPIN
jgi:hypothetical protein